MFFFSKANLRHGLDIILEAIENVSGTPTSNISQIFDETNQKDTREYIELKKTSDFEEAASKDNEKAFHGSDLDNSASESEISSSGSDTEIPSETEESVFATSDDDDDDDDDDKDDPNRGTFFESQDNSGNNDVHSDQTQNLISQSKNHIKDNSEKHNDFESDHNIYIEGDNHQEKEMDGQNESNKTQNSENTDDYNFNGDGRSQKGRSFRRAQKNNKVLVECHHCFKVFWGLNALTMHFKSRHPGLKAFKCDRCDKEFVYPMGLNHHIRVQHENKMAFFCRVCNLRLPSRQKKDFHYKEEHGDKKPLYACDKCGEEFWFYDILRTHKKNKHRLRLKCLKCKFCRKKFYGDKKLHEHIAAVHKDDKLFKCSICNKEYPCKKTFEHHQKSHSCLKCKICGTTGFRSKTALEQHRKSTHVTNHWIKCKTCGKVLKSERRYIEHMNAHTGECSFKCDVCGKTYRSEQILRFHKYTHSLPYGCETCGKKFATTANLKFHYRLHTGEKPEKCNICDKAYAYPGSLSVHMKSHKKNAAKEEQIKIASKDASESKKMPDSNSVTALPTSSNKQKNPICVSNTVTALPTSSNKQKNPLRVSNTVTALPTSSNKQKNPLRVAHISETIRIKARNFVLHKNTSGKVVVRVSKTSQHTKNEQLIKQSLKKDQVSRNLSELIEIGLNRPRLPNKPTIGLV